MRTCCARSGSSKKLAARRCSDRVKVLWATLSMQRHKAAVACGRSDCKHAFSIGPANADCGATKINPVRAADSVLIMIPLPMLRMMPPILGTEDELTDNMRLPATLFSRTTVFFHDKPEMAQSVAVLETEWQICPTIGPRAQILAMFWARARSDRRLAPLPP